MNRLSGLIKENIELTIVNDLLNFKYDDYNIKQKFYKNVSNFSYNILGNVLVIEISKKNNGSWQYLFKDIGYNRQYVGIDWLNWKDSDSDTVEPKFNIDQDNLAEMMKQVQTEKKKVQLMKKLKRFLVQNHTILSD